MAADSSGADSRDTGAIEIASDPPGASVFIDGKDTGLKTPCVANDVAVGEREITLKLLKRVETVKKLIIKKGETAKLAIKLEYKTGELKISASILNGNEKILIPAEVYIDGDLQDLKTPLVKRLKIGEHFIELKSAGKKTFKKVIIIEESQPTIIEAELSIIGSDGEAKTNTAKQKNTKSKTELEMKLDKKKEIEESIKNHKSAGIILFALTALSLGGGAGLFINGFTLFKEPTSNEQLMFYSGFFSMTVLAPTFLIAAIVTLATTPDMPEDLKNLKSDDKIIITPDITPDAKGGMLRLLWEF